MVELQLAGGDFISDVSLLRDEATQRLRGSHALPSHTTLYRFLAGADLGRVSKGMAVNRDMLRRAWVMGAAPAPGVLTIDPDATYIDTYGTQKESSRFSYKGTVQMSPLIGVVGETGDVLAIQNRPAPAGRARSPRHRRRRAVLNYPERGGPFGDPRFSGAVQLLRRADDTGPSELAVDGFELPGELGHLPAQIFVSGERCFESPPDGVVRGGMDGRPSSGSPRSELDDGGE